MSKLIGDRKFYKSVLAVAVPIIIQNGFTNLVNLLDNIMVGRIGTEQMSGVSIVNQLVFVYFLCIFGGLSGASIFTAQYYGSNDNDGVRYTCRYKLFLGSILTTLAIVVLTLFGRQLISLYLNEGTEGDLDLTLQYGLEYLHYIVWTLPPFMVVQAYAGTLRECGETIVPMKAGIASVIINFVFNYLLIYGKVGFPVLGVRGAAIATGIARYVEALIVVFWASRNKDKHPFVKGLLSSFKIPKDVIKKVVIIGMPLLLNESFWSSGMATLTQCYSMRGLDSVAGFNISSTVYNLFKIVFLAFGSTVGIIVGNLLGAGKMEEAVDTDRKLIAFSCFSCIFVSSLMLALSSVFPQIYNTTDGAKEIARRAIIVAACFMPIDAFKNSTYFTIRSGGRTWITFIFDAGYVWAISVPIAFILSRYTTLSSVQIFACVGFGDFLKIFLGYYMVKKKIWLKNIVV